MLQKNNEQCAPTRQITRDELLRIFAAAIYAKVGTFAYSLTRHQKSRIKESIGSDIRKACDLLASVAVSEAAHTEAVRLGIDLREKGWHDQHGFDRGRELFHFEHIIPVGAICNAILAQTSVEGVLEILTQRLRVVWILKSEDRELTRLGYRTKRVDPDAAYRAAGIQLRPGAVSGDNHSRPGQHQSPS